MFFRICQHSFWRSVWGNLCYLVLWGGLNKKRKFKWMNFLFLKRCLAESNRSTRFCRPLPNRSVKTPFVSEATISELRVQRYNFYLVPPNFLATFFKKTFIFCCFSLLLVYFLLFFPCFHSFFAHIAPEMGNWRIYSPYTSLFSGKFYKCN